MLTKVTYKSTSKRAGLDPTMNGTIVKLANVSTSTKSKYFLNIYIYLEDFFVIGPHK